MEAGRGGAVCDVLPAADWQLDLERIVDEGWTESVAYIQNQCLDLT